MIRWVWQLDRILRGEATKIDELRGGDLRVPVFGLAVVIDALGIAYGACMGLFSLTSGGSHQPTQIVASMLKVPALFLLTLLVTFPSLYVFNALVGSRLRFGPTLRLLVASIAVMLAVLSSIGPIVAFFSLSSTSYSFMVLLNVAVFAVAGVLGLGFLLQTLQRMTIASVLGALPPIDPPPPAPGDEPQPSPLDRVENRETLPRVRLVFRVWLLVFGLVGAQMGWVLRPFIGSPGAPFTWFRPRESNFFEAVVQHIQHLLK